MKKSTIKRENVIKTCDKIIKFSTKALLIALVFSPFLAYADINTQISNWNKTARTIAKSVMGLAAVGGACIVYFKMQNDDGNNGKRALMSFAGALIFAAVAFTVIDEIMK